MVYIDVYTAYKKNGESLGMVNLVNMALVYQHFHNHWIMKITIVVPSDFNQLSLDITIIRDVGN